MATLQHEVTRAPRLRVAAGDLDLIAHLSRVRWSLSEDLALAVGRSVPKTRQRLSALRKAGLVDFDRPTIGPAAFRATLPGLRVAGLPGPAARELSAATWLHSTTLATLCAALSAEGLAYVSEHELRVALTEARSATERALLAALAPGGRWRVPDLRVDLGSSYVAIELELHPKSSSRIRDILAAHAMAGWRVLYLCPPHVERALVKGEASLGPLRKSKLALRVRPAPVMQKDGVGPYRPDPEAARAVVRELAEFARTGRGPR